MDHSAIEPRGQRGLEERLGYSFSDSSLLQAALTHRSASQRPREHNETLEFLGDAVVGLVVSDLLFRTWPEADEGWLSRRRAALVNAKSLEERARSLRLGECLALGRGEEKTGGREKGSILADAFEALIAAVYLDGGFGAAREAVARAMKGEIESSKPSVTDETFGDYKTHLQEHTQREFRCTPEYTLLHATGPDHAKAFVCRVALQGRILGTGRGGSKKLAEQSAAREALDVLHREAAAKGEQGAEE